MKTFVETWLKVESQLKEAAVKMLKSREAKTIIEKITEADEALREYSAWFSEVFFTFLELFHISDDYERVKLTVRLLTFLLPGTGTREKSSLESRAKTAFNAIFQEFLVKPH